MEMKPLSDLMFSEILFLRYKQLKGNLNEN